jgi:2-C-methyl-D-erythritol 4-phosphate cytidylyltransferase/2-C-methyl-D-erythritol 2,4-cyclodiphosphate synthase
VTHPQHGGTASSVWAIVVAAGAGERFGGAKQYARLGGRRVLDWAVAATRGACDGVVLVVPPERVGDQEPAVDAVVAGGATRSGSVRAGLAQVPPDAAVVVVHDAARPLATADDVRSVVEAVREGADAAVPGVAVTDTIRRRGGGVVDRTTLVAVQTPQAFRAEALRQAHAGGGEASDDASLVEAAGGNVVVVEGRPSNAKLTHGDDLAAARALVSGTVSAADGPAPAAVVDVRSGQGFDIHRVGTDLDQPLVLGGVTFEGPGLVGHSDGDVIAHACAEALLGAAALGDLGQWFPDTDPTWAGADSLQLLAEVARAVVEAGWEPANVDCSVVTERPALAPRRAEMQDRLGAAAGCPVTVKGRRPEGVGALGRGEAIACWASASLVRRARAGSEEP